MNKAHLVVSQNFVFQNRASRPTRAQGRTYTPCPMVFSASLWWSLTGLFAMQTKNAGADEKNEAAADLNTWCCPLKDFTEIHLNGPRACLFLLAYLDRYPCPINLLRRRCANWTIPSGRGVFHPTGHATGEPCAARTWQPMAKRLPFQTDVFPAGVKPLPP